MITLSEGEGSWLARGGPGGCVGRRKGRNVTVLFVHGSGVREQSFVTTFSQVRGGVERVAPGARVEGHFWGDAAGARSAGPLSVPGHRAALGSEPGADLADWAVLYLDPAYELRVLSLLPVSDSGMAPGLPPADRFVNAVSSYRPSEATAETFRRHGLEGRLATAVAWLANSSELQEAAATVDEHGHEHRFAAARALVAAALAAAAEDEGLVVDGVVRDALVSAAASDLRAVGRAVPTGVRKAFTPAIALLTWQIGRHRGRLSDATLPFLGDILSYQARGEAARRLLKQRIDQLPDEPVTLLAHSLGGVLAVDMLMMESVEKVDRLVTIGSQVGFLFEAGALTSLAPGEAVPDHYRPRWLNIYDRKDFLSYRAAGAFPHHATDHVVDTGQPFPMSHGAYWSCAGVWAAIAAWIA